MAVESIFYSVSGQSCRGALVWDEGVKAPRPLLLMRRTTMTFLPGFSTPGPKSYLPRAARLAADLARAEKGRAVRRRMNRTEYENALRDLLQAPWLPLPDPDAVDTPYDEARVRRELGTVGLAS